MTIFFKNSQGEIIGLDGQMTITDLVKIGARIFLTPKSKPLPKNPRIYVHQTKLLKKKI